MAIYYKGLKFIGDLSFYASAVMQGLTSCLAEWKLSLVVMIFNSCLLQVFLHLFLEHLALDSKMEQGASLERLTQCSPSVLYTAHR